MTPTRRTVIAGGASVIAAPAAAMGGFPPAEVRDQRGFAGWALPQSAAPMPLDVDIVHEGGARGSLRQWMDGRPALLLLWALWCSPCLKEKQPEDGLLRRLRAAGSPVQILALQSFDTKSLAEARGMLERL